MPLDGPIYLAIIVDNCNIYVQRVHRNGKGRVNSFGFTREVTRVGVKLKNRNLNIKLCITCDEQKKKKVRLER